MGLNSEANSYRYEDREVSERQQNQINIPISLDLNERSVSVLETHEQKANDNIINIGSLKDNLQFLRNVKEHQ